MSKQGPSAIAPSSLVEIRRCAIYTRKSTSAGLEQDFNSLVAQREACEQYIQSQAALGWQIVPDEYSDGGYSGANIQRPAFQRLMADVEARRIDIVVVYKVDRLSRSLLDFAKLMDRFTRANVAFVSVTQNFSTADAMGRLTLNVLMSFAEFEREMIAERTRDKMAAARRKGKWTGGLAPIGYDVIDRKLVVNQTEATLVRRIFDLYLSLRSAVAVASTLNAEGRTTKRRRPTSGSGRGARPWNKQAVLNVLRNPIAAGLMSCRGEIHDGQHQAIVDRITYERVQSMLNEGHKPGARWGRNPDYLLTGLIHCACCGQAYTPASTRRGSREYRYYRCSTRDKRGSDACPAGPLSAPAIEEFVVGRIRDALADGKVAADVTRVAKERSTAPRMRLVDERQDLASKIAVLSADGKQLMDGFGSIQGPARLLLDRRLQEVGEEVGRLENRLREVERQLSLLEACEADAEWVSQCLTDFDRAWDTLSPANRGRLLRAVLDRVDVDEPKGDVRAAITGLGATDETTATATEANT